MSVLLINSLTTLCLANSFYSIRMWQSHVSYIFSKYSSHRFIKLAGHSPFWDPHYPHMSFVSAFFVWHNCFVLWVVKSQNVSSLGYVVVKYGNYRISFLIFQGTTWPQMTFVVCWRRFWMCQQSGMTLGSSSKWELEHWIAFEQSSVPPNTSSGRCLMHGWALVMIAAGRLL